MSRSALIVKLWLLSLGVALSYAVKKPMQNLLTVLLLHLIQRKGILPSNALKGTFLLSDLFKVHTAEKLPFCVLSVGSGEGSNDLSFIEMLIKSLQGAGIRPWIFQHAIEPDEAKLGSFRA